MVHNGIEYGLMQAYAEGFDIFKNANSPELAPEYRYDLEPGGYCRSLASRQRGSVRGCSTLRRWRWRRIQHSRITPASCRISGEGRWTINAPSTKPFRRRADSRALRPLPLAPGTHLSAEKILSAMRQKFGGHVGHRPPRERKSKTMTETVSTSGSKIFCSAAAAAPGRPIRAPW